MVPSHLHLKTTVCWYERPGSSSAKVESRTFSTFNHIIWVCSINNDQVQCQHSWHYFLLKNSCIIIILITYIIGQVMSTKKNLVKSQKCKQKCVNYDQSWPSLCAHELRIIWKEIYITMEKNMTENIIMNKFTTSLMSCLIKVWKILKVTLDFPIQDNMVSFEFWVDHGSFIG